MLGEATLAKLSAQARNFADLDEEIGTHLIEDKLEELMEEGDSEEEIESESEIEDQDLGDLTDEPADEETPEEN